GVMGFGSDFPKLHYRVFGLVWAHSISHQLRFRSQSKKDLLSGPSCIAPISLIANSILRASSARCACASASGEATAMVKRCKTPRYLRLRSGTSRLTTYQEFAGCLILCGLGVTT